MAEVIILDAEAGIRMTQMWYLHRKIGDQRLKCKRRRRDNAFTATEIKLLEHEMDKSNGWMMSGLTLPQLGSAIEVLCIVNSTRCGAGDWKSSVAQQVPPTLLSYNVSRHPVDQILQVYYWSERQQVEKSKNNNAQEKSSIQQLYVLCMY